MKTNAPLAIVFDLDGTLVDTPPDMHASANRMLTKAKREKITLKETHQFIGDGIERFVERALSVTDAPFNNHDLDTAVSIFLKDYEKNSSVLSQPYAGVAETLGKLKTAGHRLAVCSNKPQFASERLLEDLNLLHFFDIVCGGDRYPIRKPNPLHLTNLLNEMQISPENAAMVGDNENDSETALGAGVFFILCTYGYARKPLYEITANERINFLPDLLMLKSLNT